MQQRKIIKINASPCKGWIKWYTYLRLKKEKRKKTKISNIRNKSKTIDSKDIKKKVMNNFMLII